MSRRENPFFEIQVNSKSYMVSTKIAKKRSELIGNLVYKHIYRHKFISDVDENIMQEFIIYLTGGDICQTKISNDVLTLAHTFGCSSIIEQALNTTTDPELLIEMYKSFQPNNADLNVFDKYFTNFLTEYGDDECLAILRFLPLEKVISLCHKTNSKTLCKIAKLAFQIFGESACLLLDRVKIEEIDASDVNGLEVYEIGSTLVQRFDQINCAKEVEERIDKKIKDLESLQIQYFSEAMDKIETHHNELLAENLLLKSRIEDLKKIVESQSNEIKVLQKQLEINSDKISQYLPDRKFEKDDVRLINQMYEDKKITIYSEKYRTKCLDVGGGEINVNANIILYEHHGKSNQQFMIEGKQLFPADSNGMTIQNNEDTVFLNLMSGVFSREKPSQEIRFMSDGTIQNNEGNCLQALDNEHDVCFRKPNYEDNQKWRIEIIE